jgi:predicted nuclease of predicted toxin-antitoxin system
VIVKIKLDENLGRRAAELLHKAGHDVATVPQQQLCSAADPQLIQVCRDEGRCLVTMDLEFGNPLLFRPADYAGIVVLRLPSRLQPEHLPLALNRLISRLTSANASGKLWIVEIDKIREYQPETADP